MMRGVGFVPRWATAVVLCAAAPAVIVPLPCRAAGATSALYFGESMISVDQRGFAMGGACLGVTAGYPDPVNPASLTRSPVASFNLTYRPSVNWATDGTASQRLTSGRLSAGVFSLPVKAGITLGLGFEQLHSAQYRYAEACTSSAGQAYTRRKIVGGGVYAAGVAVAVSPLPRVGAGIGWRWLFGSIRSVSQLDFSSATYEDTDDELLQRHSGGFPAIGVVWDGGTVGLGGYWRGASTGDGSFTLRTAHEIERTTGFEFTLPPRFGVGLGIGPLHGLTVAADIWRELWSTAEYEGDASAFCDVTAFSIGAEFAGRRGERALPPIRLGYRSRPGYYLLPLPGGGVSSAPPSDEAITFGTMLGTGEGRGIVQAGIAIGRRAGVARFGLRERYVEASLGFTGFEPWTRRSLPGP